MSLRILLVENINQKNLQQRNRILLHSCCAICSGYPIDFLRQEGFEPIVYFYNPNLYPQSEFEKRLDAQKELCASRGCELILENYDNDEYESQIKGLELEPEKGKRCDKCFELRLLKTAQKAEELGIDCFTTSITISPHKNFNKIKQIGEAISDRFMAIDFKKKDGFLKTNKIAKELQLYRQNYCGCRYSIRETERKIS